MTSTQHGSAEPGPYREYPAVRGLQHLVSCLWENDVQDRQHTVIPDGCVDLIWLGHHGLVVAGADTGPRLSGPIPGPVCGIRLRPGAAGTVLGLPAAELRDQLVPVEHVWQRSGPELAATMAEADAERRLAILTEAVLVRRGAPDPVVVQAATKLAEPGVRVSAAAADLGLSERQLNRRLLHAVGYGPKMLARVARLRRLIAADEPSLALRALAAGYASQAHMNEEVRRLTGDSAGRFLKDAALTAA
ncbi:AraC family transcriptional regulator [Microlunatus parietis]|uniref:AraC-like DNA-binding protein n=1 Tax=Microlunatus parietis TaxID=682979 RepID=A0A7Y9I4L5_9ACTN|nr:helix-turn-helix domain-containing protein [Microlunatus parietis]NYE70149.1 AraC-like DNA-binding protein [Microlunatus parietis]